MDSTCDDPLIHTAVFTRHRYPAICSIKELFLERTTYIHLLKYSQPFLSAPDHFSALGLQVESLLETDYHIFPLGQMVAFAGNKCNLLLTFPYPHIMPAHIKFGLITLQVVGISIFSGSRTLRLRTDYRGTNTGNREESQFFLLPSLYYNTHAFPH